MDRNSHQMYSDGTYNFDSDYYSDETYNFDSDYYSDETYNFDSDYYYAISTQNRNQFSNQHKGSDFIGKTTWDVGNNIIS